VRAEAAFVLGRIAASTQQKRDVVVTVLRSLLHDDGLNVPLMVLLGLRAGNQRVMALVGEVSIVASEALAPATRRLAAQVLPILTGDNATLG
jgi:hypothetical protein